MGTRYVAEEQPEDIEALERELAEAEIDLEELQAAHAHGYADRDVLDEIDTLQKRIHQLDRAIHGTSQSS